MSHELRTPMNGVLGMAHALTTGPLNDQQARQVDMLIRSGEGLMTILNDVLDVSKIEAGKLELEVPGLRHPRPGRRDGRPVDRGGAGKDVRLAGGRSSGARPGSAAIRPGCGRS
jgi:hypothetical protein